MCIRYLLLCNDIKESCFNSSQYFRSRSFEILDLKIRCTLYILLISDNFLSDMRTLKSRRILTRLRSAPDEVMHWTKDDVKGSCRRILDLPKKIRRIVQIKIKLIF